MNSGRNNPTATRLTNKKVLIAGGSILGGSPPTPLASTELFDPATDTFAPSSPTMPIAEEMATATLLGNGQVLIVGSGGTALYDPASNSFVTPPAKGYTQTEAVAVLLPSGKVLFVGGSLGLDGPTAATALYDPVTNTFQLPPATPSMNVARSNAVAVELGNGKVLIAGGVGPQGILASTELYDEATNMFEPPASTVFMNLSRWDAGIATLPNGKVLIIGGFQTPDISPLASCELYDPATNTFAPATTTPVMNAQRANLTATVLANGLILVQGNNGTASLRSVELYDPAMNVFTLGPNMSQGQGVVPWPTTATLQK
jgi:hypothetical protein